MTDLSKAPDELWRWTATQIAKGVRTRAISSREATASCFKRIHEVNPTINALVEISEKEALEGADAADRAVRDGAQLGPLHGVPVSIKVNSDQKGHATTSGVAAFANAIATEDGPHVANLRKAGAVFVGRSNTPAFSYRWFTTNDLHGRTLNPWDASRTPGGSSGGAGAATATGMVPIAHGNDIGGSIRHPAFCCGVTGLRPTVGRIPSWYGPADADQPMSIQTMLTQGPLARCVQDLRLSLEAMSGFDPRDLLHASLPLVGEPLKRPATVALIRDVGIVKPQPEINAALDQAASWLQEAGYQIEEVELPLLAEAYRLWWLLAMEEFRQIMPAVRQAGDAGMLKAAEHHYENAKQWWGEKPGLYDYMNGYARRGTLVVQLQQFMQKYPLILLPVSTEPAFPQDIDIENAAGMRRCMDANWSMMALAMLGFPSASVPTGVPGTVPVGVQILGRRFREDNVLDAAEIIEARAGILTPIDPR